MSTTTQLDFFSQGSNQNARSKQDMSWESMSFACVDVETTGLDAQCCRVIEIAWVVFDSQKIVSERSCLCNVGGTIPKIITELTGISDQMLADQPPFSAYVPDLLSAIDNTDFIVAYNAKFDKGFIEAELERLGKTLPQKHWVDPYVLVKEIDRYKKGKKLVDAAKRWGVVLDNAHRALSDAKATGELLYKLSSKIGGQSLVELINKQNNWRVEQEKSYRAYLARKKI